MTAQGADKKLSEPAGGKTVYIVDDDVDMVHSLASLLRSLGYLVEAYVTAQTFLDRVEAGVSGCVLLDVRLPAVSGLEIQRRLSEARHKIPIIFLTGHGDIQMAVSAMKAGAVEFLPKPFREQQLIEAVAEAMERFERDEEDVRARNAYQQDIVSLSPKERAILDDLSSGLLIKEIAARHALSASTIRVHRRNIKSKVKTDNLGKFLILHSKYGRES